MNYGWESYLFCLGGDTVIVYDSGKYKYVLLYLTQGESQFAYLLFSCFPVFIFHTCGYAFCLSVSGNIQVDSIKLLSTLATDGQQLGLNLFYEHYFVKGFLFCKL